MTEREPMPWTGQDWTPADVRVFPSRAEIEAVTARIEAEQEEVPE